MHARMHTHSTNGTPGTHAWQARHGTARHGTAIPLALQAACNAGMAVCLHAHAQCTCMRVHKVCEPGCMEEFGLAHFGMALCADDLPCSAHGLTWQFYATGLSQFLLLMFRCPTEQQGLLRLVSWQESPLSC